MTKNKNHKFHGRSFTSFIIVLSFLIMSISGIFLYFAPPGRVALWSKWTFLFLTKEQWQAIHTILSLAFIIAAVFHIYFNWSILIGYIKKKLQQGLNKKRELLWSSILTIVLMVFTIAGVPPFSTIMDWSEDLSNSWSNNQTEPPIPHAESLTLIELAKTTQQPLDEMLQNLRNKGIEPDSNTIIIEYLAKKYHLTPQQLYEKMKIQQKESYSAQGIGAGYGRKTVEQICNQFEIPLQMGIERLNEKGIEAKNDELIKDIALEHDMLPIDVVSIIKADSSGMLRQF